MKGAHIFRHVVLKFLLDMPHQLDDFFGAFRQAQRGGRRNQALSPAHEKFGMEFLGKIVKLEAHGARGEVNFLRCPGHAWRVHHREEKLELMEDRKSTRLNSSHSQISYAVFCLKKNNTPTTASAVVEYLTVIFRITLAPRNDISLLLPGLVDSSEGED